MASSVDPRGRTGSHRAGSHRAATHRKPASAPEPGLLPRPTISDRLPRPWLFPLLAFAGVWVLSLAAWQVGNALYHSTFSWTDYSLFKDANVYVMIGRYGYHIPGPASPHNLPPQLGFFPLFPMLIRGVALVTGLDGDRTQWAGLIVSVLAGAAAAVTVWALARRLRDSWTADRAVLLFCAFPGAMTFSMIYSDPLGIALVAGSLLAAVNRRWVVAGLVGALATAEHPTALVLVAVLGIGALQAIWARREWIALVAPVLTPLGALAYFVYLKLEWHHFLGWYWVERHYWRQRMDWGYHILHAVTWTDPATRKYHLFNLLITLVFVALIIGIGLMIADRLPLMLTVYSVLILLSITLSPATGPKPRFAWAAFGIFIAAAARLPKLLYWPVLVASAGLTAYLITWWPHHLVGPSP